MDKVALNKISVLYVEQGNADSFTIQTILQNEVENLYVARNGQEGYEKYLEFKPDIIITDLYMPVLNGLKMIKSIREKDKNIPIIVVSDFEKTEYFLELIKMKVSRYFLKPVDKKEILNVVAQAAQAIVLRQKSVEQNMILQNILNAKKHIAIITDFKTIYFVNKIFLDFFNLKDINGFNEEYDSILDVFNEHRDYISKNMLDKRYSNHIELGKAFFELVKSMDEIKRVVLLLDSHFELMTYHLDITIVDEKNHRYLLNLTDVTGLITEKNIVKSAKEKLEVTNNELTNAIKIKSSFLANMSHEIRTPLNAIFGLISVLKEKETNEENKRYLEVIDDSSKQLLNIIGDILDFSKIESKKLVIEKVDFNPRKELKNIIYLFDTKSSKKNIILTMLIDEEMPEFLYSDYFRIKQILSNLISNAIKFTPSGKKIIVRASYKNKRLFIEVEDEGIGISKDKQKTIFDPFSQEDGSITRKYGGTGLGLAICSNLVKLLNGKMTLESEKGKGSKFSFSIPVEIGKKTKDEPDKIEDKTKFNGKVLLVEDNEANQMFMKIILKKLGLSFDIANDGVQAVNMFKSGKYDIILMDINMPNMDGVEATKNILDFESANSLIHTPIIALTANALGGDRKKFLDEGMDEYLAKPINKKKLSKVLARFL